MPPSAGLPHDGHPVSNHRGVFFFLSCLSSRLEESSAALCAQMERLEQEMEQERKKQRMLEIKLRNSERAREDAENRNRLLEKEMEDFFSTLGDLALGSRTSDI